MGDERRSRRLSGEGVGRKVKEDEAVAVAREVAALKGVDKCGVCGEEVGRAGRGRQHFLRHLTRHYRGQLEVTTLSTTDSTTFNMPQY